MDWTKIPSWFSDRPPVWCKGIEPHMDNKRPQLIATIIRWIIVRKSHSGPSRRRRCRLECFPCNVKKTMLMFKIYGSSSWALGTAAIDVWGRGTFRTGAKKFILKIFFVQSKCESSEIPQLFLFILKKKRGHPVLRTISSSPFSKYCFRKSLSLWWSVFSFDNIRGNQC